MGTDELGAAIFDRTPGAVAVGPIDDGMNIPVLTADGDQGAQSDRIDTLVWIPEFGRILSAAVSKTAWRPNPGHFLNASTREMPRDLVWRSKVGRQ